MDRVEPALVSVGIRPADWWLDPIQVPKLVAGARLLETAMATAQKNSTQFQSAVVHVAEGFETTGHVDQKSVLELAHSMGGVEEGCRGGHREREGFDRRQLRQACELLV